MEYVTPEGFRYRVAVKHEMELAMEVTDEFGDTVRFSRRVGDGVGRSFSDDIAEHLENVVRFDRDATKGLTGCHNMDKFYDYMKNQLRLSESDFIEKIIKHPTVDGIYEITYKVPIKDIYGNLTGEYKIFKLPKTVYDPSIISTQQIMEWGKVALNSDNIVIKGRIIEGFAPNGLKFRGYLNQAGEITNFHPVFEGR